MAERSNHSLLGATRIIERSGQRVLVVRRSRISVEEGPDSGSSAEIGAMPVTVGTAETCRLRLCDRAVSATHLSIEPNETGFLLRDLGSTNGTWISGLRIDAVHLPETASIRLGDTVLRFQGSDDELELPLSRRSRFGPLIGQSPAMRSVFAILEKVAKTDATLLIEGESGTGKDVAARALHEASPRRDAPFIALDCGAIPESLVESELFGHAKGAFTGAGEHRRGPFEEANGGSVFLDEIGELPLELQPKLLRTLETRSVRRLGEGTPRAFDVRLIAATNRDLAAEVAAGRFRQDLYFRLSVIHLQMPPLRQRKEEIPRLIAHFSEQLGRDPAAELPPALLHALQSHSWPGNVRELRNVVERIAVLPDMDPSFYLAGLKPSADNAPTSMPPVEVAELDTLPFHEGKQRCIDGFERTYLQRTLARCGGNVSELARVSGLSRQSCHRLLSRHGLG